MIASVETDVFALDLAPAAKLGRDSLFLYHDSLRFPGPHLDQGARKLLIINNRHFLHREMTGALITFAPFRCKF